MMNYKVKDGKVTELVAQGPLTELLSGTAFLVYAIYSMLAQSSEETAKMFQTHFVLMAADLESPMWEKDAPDCLSIVQTVKPKEGESDDK